MTTRRTAKKKEGRTLINGGTTPVVYTDDGRVIAAGERVEVESLDGTAAKLIDLGYLTVESGQNDTGGDRDEDDTPGESLPKSAS